MPYHWDDRSKLFTDYQQLQQLYEILLNDLAESLNQFHSVNHSIRYWRILIGPWLGYFVQIVFDRWECITQAVNGYDISGTVLLQGGEDLFVPSDMVDFCRLFTSDSWNHAIYAEILSYLSDLHEIEFHCKPRKRNAQARNSENEIREVLLRHKFAMLLSKIAAKFSREDDIFMLSTYLPFRCEIGVHKRFNQLPQYWRIIPPLVVACDMREREWDLCVSGKEGFEGFVRSIIPRNIPTLYLEGYEKLIKQTIDLPWPKRPKVIWTSNAHNAEDVFKAWAAGQVERGVPLVIGQHGGHYGTGLWSFIEDHELKISDRYFSWGWTNSSNPNIRPIGQLKAKKPLNVKHSTKKTALLVTAIVPRYSYWMFSVIVSKQWLDYFNDQCAFADNLPSSIRSALVVRLYSPDFGWDQVARWRDKFLDIHIDDGRSKILSLIKSCRIYISTYNATTFLESITMDVPTVMFWNPEHWELRESAKPFFLRLQQVGVFHDSAISAANHVARVWDNIDAWWYSDEVRSALVEFSSEFCRVPKDLVGDVESALRDVLAEKSRADQPG